MAFLFLAQIPLYHRVLQLYARLRLPTENSLFGTLQTSFPALFRQILRWAKGWTSGSGPPYLNNWRKDTYTRTIAVFCENSPFLKFSVTSDRGHPHRKRRMKNLDFPGETKVTGCCVLHFGAQKNAPTWPDFADIHRPANVFPQWQTDPGRWFRRSGWRPNEKPEDRPRTEPQVVVFVLALHFRALKRCGQECRTETREPIVWRTTRHDASFQAHAEPR